MCFTNLTIDHGIIFFSLASFLLSTLNQPPKEIKQEQPSNKTTVETTSPTILSIRSPQSLVVLTQASAILQNPKEALLHAKRSYPQYMPTENVREATQPKTFKSDNKTEDVTNNNDIKSEEIKKETETERLPETNANDEASKTTMGTIDGIKKES